MYPRSFLLASLFLLAGCASVFRRHRLPGSLCNCDAGIDTPCFNTNQEWERATLHQLEVRARDFKRQDLIGMECESEGNNLWQNVWLPVTGQKRTLVGTLHHFNWNYADDEDWNLHVIPNTFFSDLITVVEALHDESIDEHRKCGGPRCMEAEISPDQRPSPTPRPGSSCRRSRTAWPDRRPERTAVSKPSKSWS